MVSLHPTARSYLSLVCAFAVATALRSACFNPRLPIFGKDLAENLAPVERNDVSWSWIALVRVIDLVTYIYIWHRETGGHKARTDAPVLGALLQCISRVPLYLLLGHHFLLSDRTLFQVFITDVFAYAAAMYTISKLEPKHPAFFVHPLLRSGDNGSLLTSLSRSGRLEMLVYAISLATFVNALYSFISERRFMQQFIRDNVLAHEIPAFLSAVKPSFAYAMKHPTIAIPVLRSATGAMSMPKHLAQAVPLSLLATFLHIVYLPQKSPLAFSALVFALVFPSNALSVFNLLPVSLKASVAIGFDNALRASTAAFIVSWLLQDLTRPARGGGAAGSLSSSDGIVLKDVADGGTGEVVIVGKDSVTVRREIEPVEIIAEVEETVVVESE